MLEKIDALKTLMLDIADHWDETQIVHYPKELPSFDELLNLVLSIEIRTGVMG